MTSLLDGYEEVQTPQPQQPIENTSSLLDGYTPAKKQASKAKKKVVSAVNNNNVSDELYSDNVQPEKPLYDDKTGAFNAGIRRTTINNTQPEKPVSIPEGLFNIAKSVGTGVSRIPQGVVHFGKSLIDDSVTTAKNIVKEPSLIPAIIPAMGKGLINGLVHDVTQGVADIPEAISSAYQGRPFQEKIHVPRFTETVDGLAKLMLEKGIYTPEQYAKYQELQAKAQGTMDKLPIAQTAGMFMMPAGEVANTAKTAGLGKAVLHGAGFGAVMPGSLEDKVSNAGTGAVLAGGLGLAGKAPVAEIAGKVPDMAKRVYGRIVEPMQNLISQPTSFDKLKSISAVNTGLPEQALNNIRLRSLQNDIGRYNSLLDIQQSGEYSGQKLTDAQSKAVKRKIYQLEDSFKAQNDFINQNIKKLDYDTLKTVQSNLQGRYSATPVKDGYNVYGVPVDGNLNKINSINEQLGKIKTNEGLKQAEIDNQAGLQRFREKVAELNRQRAEQNLPELTSDEIKQMPEFRQLTLNFDVENNFIPDKNSLLDGYEEAQTPQKGYYYEKTPKTDDQHYDKSTLYKNGKELGFVETTGDNNSISIDYVRNISGEKGIGSKLIDDLVKENPDKQIIWDAVDDNASIFKDKYLKKRPELKSKIHTSGDYYNAVEMFKKMGYNDAQIKDFFNGQNNNSEFGSGTSNSSATNNEYDLGESRTAKTGKSSDESGGFSNRGNKRIEIEGDFARNSEKLLDTENAVTNWGKKQYDKTSEEHYSEPRVKLENISSIKLKHTKEVKNDKAQNLESAKNYVPVVKDAVRNWTAEIEKRRFDVNKDITEFINSTRKLSKKIGISDKNIRELMPFLRERTELPEQLNRPELKKAWESLTPELKNELTEIADKLSEKFETYWKEYQDLHAGDREVTKQEIENYITHIWDLDKKQKALVTNFFSTRSRFAKERTIDTLFKGIEGFEAENGETVKLTPKTLDYAELLKIQSDSLIKATVDKALADFVKELKTGKGVSLVMPASKAPSDWVTINHPAINKTVVSPMETNVGEVMTPKLQNILADMGVAVGRRLNSKSKNAGVYKGGFEYVGGKVHQIKEISLQRWFSNKTLAHEIGHAIDKALGLGSDFVSRHREELLELNEERINALSKQGKGAYSRKHSELIAELFGYLFNDPKMTAKIAPNATAEVLAKMTESKTFRKLLPENFDWKNAKGVIEEKTVQMFKTPVKVHPDIADTLMTVFETPENIHPVMKFVDNTNAVMKQFELGFSGFHGMALSESALASLGIKDLGGILNPVKMFNAVKNNDWDIYKKDAIAKQAIEDGVQIGATLDIHRKLVEDMLENSASKLNKIPIIGKYISLPAKILSKGQELNNKILWDYLHNQFKLTTYENLIERHSQKGKISDAMRKEIGQWVNDNYGGQVWENLGFKPSVRRWSQRVMLSPDWFISTTRHFLGIFSSEAGQKFINAKAKENAFWEKARDIGRQWGIGSITDDVVSAGVRGKIARKFWTRAFINYTLYANALNSINRQRDKEENPDLYPEKMTPKDYSLMGNVEGSKTYVFLGRNSDGTERYWRLGKQFREVPELVEKPLEKLGGKASPVAQLTAQAFTGKTLSGFENKNLKDKEGLQKVGAMSGEIAKSFLPYSFSGLTDPKKDLNAYEFFAPTNRGMTFYKGRERYMDAIKKKDKEEIKKITNDIKRNKLNPDDIFNSAVKEIRKEAYKNMMRRIEEKKGR